MKSFTWTFLIIHSSSSLLLLLLKWMNEWKTKNCPIHHYPSIDFYIICIYLYADIHYIQSTTNKCPLLSVVVVFFGGGGGPTPQGKKKKIDTLHASLFPNPSCLFLFSQCMLVWLVKTVGLRMLGCMRMCKTKQY